jgi:hypothetical protein
MISQIKIRQPNVIQLIKKVDIPKELVLEIEDYKKRNFFPVKFSVGEKVYCPNCLKAFAIMKAKEMNLGEEIIYRLEKEMRCTAGHNGYYKDKNKIVGIKK